MTRNTQGNIVENVSSVLAVGIRPLDKSRTFVKFSTIFARGGFAKLSSQPVVESSVTNIFSFPRVMFVTCDFFSQRFLSLLTKFFREIFVNAVRYSSLHNFLVSHFRITFPRAIISWFNLGGRSQKFLITI